MNLATKATVSGFKKVYPRSKITAGANYWEKGLVKYFYLEDELSSTVNDIAGRALKDSKFFYAYLKKALDLAKKFNIYSQRFKRNLRNRTDQELLSEVLEFSEKFFQLYSYGTFSSLIGYFGDNLIYKRSEEILKKKLKDPKDISAYLIDLTNPPKRLKAARRDLKILELARMVKNEGLKTKKEISIALRKEIKDVKEEFGWLSFDFCDASVWEEKNYLDLIYENSKDDTDDKIRALKNYEESTAKKFINAIKKLGLTQKERKVFELIRNLAYYKWAREFEFQEGLFNFKRLQDELGARIGLTTIENKYLLFDEFSEALRNPAGYRRKIKKRLKNFLVIDGKKTRIFEGGEAKIRFKEFNFEKKFTSKNMEELIGTTANLGEAKGRVKIINFKSEMGKMQKGDIIVSQATGPELLPAMRKAAAIVTNEGGITCHAAIVSRELGIPCVIGTKIATQVLKDGDEIEVDANKGLIKILN